MSLRLDRLDAPEYKVPYGFIRRFDLYASLSFYMDNNGPRFAGNGCEAYLADTGWQVTKGKTMIRVDFDFSARIINAHRHTLLNGFMVL